MSETSSAYAPQPPNNRDGNKTVITRFAPSPTGRLHLGHAYSALFAYEQAKKAGGRFLLRIEDIDTGRCRPEYEQAIYEDLTWLGLEWETPVRRQSEHFDDYKNAIELLEQRGLVYPCFCTRKEIEAEIAASGSAPHGPDGLIYPGTCRHLSAAEREERIAQGTPYARRLFIDKAIEVLKKEGQWPLYWHDREKGKQLAQPGLAGDVVLARKDSPTSYHLSVTLDDHIQGINLVTRGEDLFHATHIHRFLQALLGLNVPQWHHHALLLDEEGKRFAKRNKSVTLQYLREKAGKSAEDILALIKQQGAFLLFLLGLTASLTFFYAADAVAQSAPVSQTVPQTASQPAPQEDSYLDLTTFPDPNLTVEEAQAAHLQEEKKKSFVTLAVENDVFASGTDRNYTSGLRLSYYRIGADIPDFFKEIDPLIPVFNINETTSIFWSVGQNLYTPEDITAPVPDPDDRPYAAWLYSSAGLATTVDNVVNELEFTLGVVGPWALGDKVQEGFHAVFDFTDPNGWDYQLENEPGIILSWRRRWPEYAATSLGPLHLSFEPSLETALGNIYTYAGTGLFARIGPKAHIWQDLPARVRPAMPGTGYFGTPENGGSWYLFAGAEGRAVAHNIFLDGNSFEDSPSVDKKHLVSDITAGLALSWRDIRVSYSATWRSPEFENDDSDLFGAVTLTYRY